MVTKTWDSIKRCLGSLIILSGAVHTGDESLQDGLRVV